MHPAIVCLCVAILISIIHNLLAPKSCNSDVRGRTIGVLLVSPPGAEVEPRILALMHAATLPQSIRFYVAKLCSATEDDPAIQNMRLRVCTRMHYVRQGHVKDSHLRARLVRDVLERNILVLDWYHRAEIGWDETLLAELERCQSENGAVVLTSQMLPTFDDTPGFLTVHEHSDDITRLGFQKYANVPKRPVPSIAVSAKFMFGDSDAIRFAWPSAEIVRENGEDPTLSASIWMHGIDAFAPAHTPFCKCEGAPSHATHDDHNSMHIPNSSATVRSRNELFTHMGIRNGRVTSRARAGLSQHASAQERFAKLGQTFNVHREIASSE